MSYTDKITVEQLAWVSACLVLALAAQLAVLPPWVMAASLAPGGVRLVLALRGRDAPPRVVRAIIAMALVGALFIYYRTFNGLSAGTALLSLIAGLKILESRTRRDLHVITFILYFLCLAALLQGESFWMLAYLIAVCWLTSAALLRSSPGAGRAAMSLRYAARLLAQAMPLAVALWVFFPRIGAPLWQLPDSGAEATSGLGDSMSPGDITALALSDEVAFRVRFEAGGAPKAAERYWRGPVLHDFDGHAWHRTDAGPTRAAPLRVSGRAYRYTVSLEPNRHNWLFVLDWPWRWDVARGVLTDDYMLVQPATVDTPMEVSATSYAHVEAAGPLAAELRVRDTQLPQRRNPRTAALARQLRERHPDDLDYIHAVLELFATQPFYYTLTPPRLGEDSVDGFLFDTRRGFCGHYASAFAALLRAAGIPTRVVTGYQGGTYNRFADYWIVRQSDAHAWDEAWIEGHGWLRVDPTASIAPERVERGLNELTAAGLPEASRWQQRARWPALTNLRLRLDTVRLLWRERIVGFDQRSQERLLEFLHVPAPGVQQLAIALALCLVTAMAWLTWQLRREAAAHPRDPLRRAYERLCRRLSAAGIARLPHEGAEAYGERIAALRPDLAPGAALCLRYSQLRYGERPAPTAVKRFIAAVRCARPRARSATPGVPALHHPKPGAPTPGAPKPGAPTPPGSRGSS